MTENKTMQDIKELLRIIPIRIRDKLTAAFGNDTADVHEIVLRTERPVCVYKKGERYFLTSNGCLTQLSDFQELVNATTREMTDCFNFACGHSVYSHINEIKEGFVTLTGGHRVSICGSAVVSSGEIINIRDISTISIRMSRQIFGCGKLIADELVKSEKGILICGAPCSGKTTVLRDIARLLSTVHARRVSIVDTRSEIAAVYKGISGKDIGYCDVLDAFPRYEGITQAIRTLSPEFIVCDELGTIQDVQALSSGVNSGAVFVATMHASCSDELRNRAHIKDIIATGAFEKIVFLRGRNNPGIVKASVASEDLFK